MISSALARVRPRLQARGGATIGAGTRFGRGVRCHVAPGGRIVIGARVEIAPGVSLTAGPDGYLEIGDGTFIGPWCSIAASGRLTIGQECMLAEHVMLRDHDHDPAFPPRSGRMLQADVAVGDRVWIAAKASVGRGVTIGDDAVIGAHAFVSKDVPPDCVAAGVPARVVRHGVRTPHSHP